MATVKTEGSIRTLDRVVRILTCLEEHPMPLTGVSVATGLNSATTLRLLRGLVEHGLAERDRNGSYRLGLRLLELARSAKGSYGTREIATTIMRRLADETEQTTFLLVRSEIDGDAICLERVAPRTPVRIEFMDVGDRIPITVGAGPKVLLAFGEPVRVEEVLGGLPPDAADSLAKELKAVRAKGVCLSIAEYMPGTAALGAPVRDSYGRVVAALSISGLLHQFDKRTLDDLVAKVCLAAEEVSQQLARREMLE